MLSIYPRNQSSCPAVAGAFFYINLHLAQASVHTGENKQYSAFKVRFFRPFVSRRGRAVFLLISLTMRSPLTNTDETRDICSESAQFAQSFTESLRVWGIMGDLGRIWLGLRAPDGGGEALI